MVLTRSARRTLQELEENFTATNSDLGNDDSTTAESLAGSKSKDKNEEDSKIFNRITIGTINIRNGNGGNLELACSRLQRSGLDIVFVTEAKLRRGR